MPDITVPPDGGSEESFGHLLDRARTPGKGSSEAWRQVCARLRPAVEEAVDRELLDWFGPADDSGCDLKAQVVRAVWRQFREIDLPPDESEGILAAAAAATAVAEIFCGRRRAFDRLWEACSENFRETLAARARLQKAILTSAFEAEVRCGAWFSAPPPEDCAALAEVVARVGIAALDRYSLEWDQWVKKIQDAVLSSVRGQFSGRPNLHEDIVQESWARLLKDAKSREILRTPRWKGYIRTIVYHAGLDILAREGLG